ncbi:MAG: hypothetical protein ACKV2V_15230 [Blastocatellia bacterium]
MSTTEKKSRPAIQHVHIHGPGGDGAIVLAGDPASITGVVRLHNRGPEKIIVREAWLLNLKLHLSQPEGGTAPACPVSFSGMTVDPGAAQTVSLRLDLDRRTPPGEYQGELHMAGLQTPARLYVMPSVRARVSPRPCVIDRRAGASVTAHLAIANEGNVPLYLSEIGQVPLFEDLLLRRSVASILSGDTPALLENLAPKAADDGGAGGAVSPQKGTLLIRNEALTLAPGETRRVEIEVRLPDHLQPNTRYLARFPLYTTEIEFVIVPSGNPAPD